MTRKKLIEDMMAQFPHLSKQDVDKIVTLFFEQLSETLLKGDRVELRGFGTFSVKKRPARVGRNPRTGEQVKISEKVKLCFKAGKPLNEFLNK